MRMHDLFQLAIKNIKGRWALLPAAGVAAGVFCLCFAGAILTTVRQEKARPYELIVSSGSNAGITDRSMMTISEIPDVAAVTAVLQIPVSMKTGKYEAQLTLTGVDAKYLTGKFTDGGSFQSSSAMPYIILNAAACRQFSENKEASDDAPEIDWLNAAFLLQAGEGSRPVTSKVCGIFEDAGRESMEPAAYISLSTAKGLLRSSGQSADYPTAYVRVVNMGQAVKVSKAITALGLAVTNSNAGLQEKWNGQIKEMRYLLMLGMLSLICSAALIAAWRRTYIAEHKPVLDMLRCMGVRQRDIGRLYAMQSLFLFLTGAAAGISVSIFLPWFLPAELVETSCFALPIPFNVIGAGIMICIAVILLGNQKGNANSLAE